MNINLSGVITGITTCVIVLSLVIRDHIVLWHTKKDVDDMNDPKTGIQVQLSGLDKQISEIRGCVKTILKLTKQNNNRR